MPLFAGSGSFSTAELKHINRCRLFLRVVSLADIANGTGTHLVKWAWSGEVVQHLRRSSARWPYQIRPGARSWLLWRRALKQCCAPSLQAPLVNPLDSWTTNNHLWFYSPSVHKLYSLGMAYSRGPRGTYCYRTQCIDLPMDAQPAIVSRKGRGEFVWEGSRPYQPQELDPRWNSVRAFIDSQSMSLRWALKDCEGWDSMATVLTAITTGHCVILSDGSFQENFSTAAYLMVRTIQRVA